MTIPRSFALSVLLCMGALPAIAATTPLANGSNITLAVEAATDGDIIQLSTGDYYSAITGPWNDATAFAITKRVKIIGLGTSPSQVKLHAGSGSDYAVKFTRYTYAAGNPGPVGNPSGARLENLTIDSANGGIQVLDYSSGLASTLTDITIKNVVIQTAMAGGSFGVLLMNTDRIVVDGVTVTSFQSGIQLINANGTLVMNSTVTNTGSEAAAGLGVFGGSGNTIVGNTIGTAKAVPSLDSGYAFNAGGVVFYNSQANRFENNTVQGHRDDGLDFHALDLTGTLTGTAATQQSIDNYAGKNIIISTGFAAGRTAGSAIWVNCSSNNSWLYANDAQGSAECGTCVYLSKNNMLLANNLHNNRLVGAFISGGAETPPTCPIPAYQQKPSANFLHSNNMSYNGSDQFVVRSSDSTTVASNFMSAKNGFGGASQTCVTTGCQGAFVLEGDPANSFATSNGVLIAANTSPDNQRGIQSDDGRVTGLEFYANRVLLSSNNRFVSSGQNTDWGPRLGGNYWSQHNAAGNPSATTPFTGIFDNLANQTGLVVDRYPYQTEDFGRGHNVTVFEPIAGSTAPVAAGTRRTVRWYAPGCTYADISLDGITSLGSNLANTGYAVVTIPASTSSGTHTMLVQCKDSLGTIRGQGSSASFAVKDSSLQLMAPGRDDVFNASREILVGWKKSPSATNVDIEYSADKGATFLPLLTGQTGTFARVTLPNITSSAYMMIRVISGNTAGDSTDGVFALRGTSGAGFTNVSAGRKFVMGQLERLEWSSPQNSRLLDISATVGATTVAVATNLPDRGNFDWIVPDLGAGAVTLTVNFKTSGGSVISTASISQGNTLYPTTITFGAAPALTAGGNATVSATTNSSAPVTFSSLTTGVCTISGSTVTGVLNGTCTIAANAPATGSYNIASQATQSFAVVATSIARLVNISTRGQVQTGYNVMIGGFIIGGSTPKKVLIRAVGPTLANYGVTGVLADPMLELHRSSDNSIIASNDDWGSASNAAEITATTLAPVNSKESAILIALDPGAYTAIVTGKNAGTGVGIVEVYEIDHPEIPLINISTRGRVEIGDSVMIGGFIIQGNSPQTVLIRAVGPNLLNYGVTGVLADPMLELHRSSDGAVIATNDNWGTASNAAAIAATGLAPVDPKESAILITLQPGAYTAIVSGSGGGTGVGIIEVFAR